MRSGRGCPERRLAQPVLGDGYVVGELLGAGGMGEVYAASHPDMPRIAVKVMNEGFAGDPAMRARFAEEARAAQRVSHRNVVRVLDHGTAPGGSPFLVMERVDGISLSALVRRDDPLPLARIAAIAAQILGGLAAIHRAVLVHGDMKSGNVLVDAERGDRVTIIDFGLTRPPATDPPAETALVVSGTPSYMAPELIRGEPITVAADLYAVGTMLYEMLTGATPFGGGTAGVIFERHLTEPVVPPSLRCEDPTIPIALERAILRALEKAPEARQPSADALASELERAILDAPSGAEPPRRRAAFSTIAPTCDWSPLQ